HQVHVIAADQLEQPGFLFLLGLRGDGQVVKVHSVGLGEELQVGVVGDHGDDVCVQQSAALAVQQIVETVTEFGHHDDRAWPLTTQVEVPFDGRPGRAATEVGGQRGKSPTQRILTDRVTSTCLGDELCAQEEASRVVVTVLLTLGDVATVLGQKVGHGSDDAPTVGARKGQDVFTLTHRKNHSRDRTG